MLANIPKLSDSVESSAGIHRSCSLSWFSLSQQFFCSNSTAHPRKLKKRKKKRNPSEEETCFVSGIDYNPKEKKSHWQSSIESKMKSLSQRQRGQMSYYAKKPLIECIELVRKDSSAAIILFILIRKTSFETSSLNIAIICKTGWKCLLCIV